MDLGPILEHKKVKSEYHFKLYDKVLELIEKLLKAIFHVINAPFFVVIEKYVIFVLFFVFLFMGFMWMMRSSGFSARNNRRLACKNSANGKCTQGFKLWSYMKTNPAHMKPRPKYLVGRCDNATMVENGSKCINLALAPDIVWDLSKRKQSDGGTPLPPAIDYLVKKLAVVVIPYTMKGGKIVPDCSKAFYKDDKQRKPVPFIQDRDTHCAIVDVDPPVYGDRYRHKDARLDDWANIETVDCGDGSCLQ